MLRRKNTVPFYNPLKQRILGLKFGAKMTLFYVTILVVSLLTSTVLYQQISASIMSRKVSDISFQNLRLIDSGLRSLIESVSNYSITIMADENNIQRSLRNATYGDLATQRTISRYLLGMVEMAPQISSIYIFDNYGNRYYADTVSAKTCRYPMIRQASWFDEVTAKKGGYILKLNAGNIFKSNFARARPEKYVSLIRVINDLELQQPLGILIVNIASDSFLKSFENIGNEYGTNFILNDDRGRMVAEYCEAGLRRLTQFQWRGNQSSAAVQDRVSRKWFLLSSIRMGNLNWRLISLIPFDELSRESRLFSFIALVIILVNGLLLFFSSILISKLITVPINKLLHSMKDVEKGRFQTVDIRTHSDEIGRLKDGYNMMVLEIQKLIQKRVAEQKILRKAELDVLQAQIKPHFLYNSFDAISALALAGRNEEVYTLSKGREVITLEEELETVRSYLTIQKIRYGPLFEVRYDIDAGIGHLAIPKLILQPLAENALYHGIRPKGSPGWIRIGAKDCRDHLELTVADDGVGMGGDMKPEESPWGKTVSSGAGFGLCGTIERLRIFYGVEDIVKITSEPGKGTLILIRIPVEGRKENGEWIVKCIAGG